MDATQGTSGELQNELDMWLHCCDICINVATSPVATTCGHFLCRSCLNEAFQREQARPGPVCGTNLLEETAQSFPIDRIGAPAEPIFQTADSEIRISNAENREPSVGTLMRAPSSLISTARMDVVQDYLEDENEHTLNIQLTLSRRVSDMRRERIRELEKLVENLVQMNLFLLRELEDCEHDRRRMNRRILEQDNSTVPGSNTLASAFARHQRRVIRRIRPTATAAGNDEAAPESAEGRLFTTIN